MSELANDFFVSLFIGLSHDQNLRKMRMLTFMQMSENKKELDYSVIQKELDLQESDIEEFIIDSKFSITFHMLIFMQK